MFKKSVFLLSQSFFIKGSVMKMKFLYCSMVALMALASCVKKDIDQVDVRKLDSTIDAETIRQIEASGQPGIPFPEGSEVSRISENVYEIKLPAKYYYVVSYTDNSNNRIAQLTSVSVTCTCSEGSGCSPVKHDGEYYCVMNSNCKTCSMSTTRVAPSGNNTPVTIVGLLNKNVGITLLSEVALPKSEKGDLINHEKIFQHVSVIHGNAFTELFGLNDVKKYFNEMGEGYKERKIKPNRYAYMSIYGNLALVPIMEGFEIEIDDVKYVPKMIPASLGVAAVTCKCTKGSGCKKKAYPLIFGTTYYCEANKCKQCTLND